MRITIFASGSRGDVQPMIALALGLERSGHTVTLAAPQNFRASVHRHGLTFYPFAVDVEELMRSELGRAWLGHSSHSPVLEMRLVSRLVSEWAEQMAAESIALAGTADLFLSGVMTLDVVDALVQTGGGAHVIALLAPFHASRSGDVSIQAPRPGRESRLNRIAGLATQAALGYGFGSPGAATRQALDLAPRWRLSIGRSYRNALATTSTVLGASPLVVPPPRDWPAWVRTTGYWFLPTDPTWRPSSTLNDFLDEGDPPVYVGFGSMSTRDAKSTLETIASGLRRAGRRGVVHSGGADLGLVSNSAELSSDLLLVDDVPHDWLFPRTAGVIHHGGAGTTAAGLRSGVPSGVVPHIGDQPFWGRRVAELGVGARPVARHKLTPEKLASMMEQFAEPQVIDRAAEFGQRIRAENGVDDAVSFIERWSSRP